MNRLQAEIDHLKLEKPELLPGWQLLVAWLANHESSHYLDLRDLSTNHRRKSLQDLNNAIDLLINRGELVQVYKLVDPSTHTLLPGEYQSPPSVPPVVRNRQDQIISTEDLELVPLLRVTK